MTKPLNITVRNNLRLMSIPTILKKTLCEKLKIPNPKYFENVRMGRWNRGTPKVLRFYDNVNNGLWIPRGYLRQLIRHCRNNDIPYQLIDKRRCLPPVDFSFTGSLKPFQATAVNLMSVKDFGTLTAPTGSGKTVMAIHMMANRRQPTLVIVHTKDLAYQWVNQVERFLNIPNREIGFIGDGKVHLGEKITIALVQSLYKRVEEVSNTVGFLVVDECHRCPSRMFTDAVTAFDSKYMMGLSATPWRRDKLSRLIFWHLGDVHHEVDKDRLIRSGDVLPAEVVVRETAFKPYYDPSCEYSKMLSELTTNDERNYLIAEDIARETDKTNGVCLVLSDRKKHCETLQALLRYKFKVSTDLLTGDVGVSERKKIIKRLDIGSVKVLVATGQLVGEGFDCKNLSTLFLATPIRFSGRVIQYLGRVLRPAPGKMYARVFDYVDVHIDQLKHAAKARQKVYQGHMKKIGGNSL